MTSMIAIGKLFCLVLYALALVGLAGWIPAPLATWAVIGAALVLVVHVIELPFFFKYIRRYPGSLASSVVQALLFGAFHSLPLMRAAQA
jgi:uncharacterized protein YhhL (DUF1145 family)